MSRTTTMVSAISGGLTTYGRFFPDCWSTHFNEQDPDIPRLVLPGTFNPETAFALKELRLAVLVETGLKGFPVASADIPTR